MSGSIEAPGSLSLGAQSLTNSGTIGADNALNIATSGDIATSGTIEGATL